MAARQELAFDFRSDTVTQPTENMKAFMMEAELGDDVFQEDPTTIALQERVARLTGMEAALFFPSGSMANLAALITHAAPGKLLYAGATSHIKLYELGSYARIAGLNLFEIDDSRGYLDLEQLRKSWSPDIYYMPEPGLVAVENTHNMLGGLIYPIAELQELSSFTRARNTPLHMDGARLLHAVKALDEPVTAWTRHVDSVMISISKGLGAPVGSVLAGKAEFIGRALRHRKLLGGGLRQSGILAAGGLYALEHHLPLLARDHARCARVYEGIRDLDWLDAVPPLTNILIFRMKEPRAREYARALDARGIRLLAISEDKVRAVFHLHISEEACERLITLTRHWGVAS